MKKLNMYDSLSILIIIVFMVVLLSRFDIYPVFVDIYYHMSVALSFDRVGGIVLWDFWEFAPEGRPHLYPPFLHCIMLLLSEVADHIAVGKFISFIMFPASQITLWVSSREIFSRKTAFYALLVLSSSLMYFRLQAVTSAAALVLVLVPLVFYSFEKGKVIAPVILLTACLYTHVGMGPIALSAFVLYSILRRERLKEAAKVVAASLILYIPWGLHTLVNMESLSANSPPSAGSLMLFPWIFGIIGMLICVRKKKEFLIPVCLFACMTPIAFSYWGRFTGHSVLPLAMFSGIALSQVDEKLTRTKKTAFIIGALFVVSLVAPTIGARPERGTNPQRSQRETMKPQQRLTITFASLLVALPTMQSDSYLTHDNLKMAEIIRKNSQQNEIVFIQGGSWGCFVTATTGRPQALGMWQEVAADYEPDPRSASVFVIPKERRVPGELTKIGETDRWAVYRTAQKRTVDIPRATVGKGIVYMIMILGLCGLLYDLCKKTAH